ncbi:MAG: ATP-dependent Clp protease ATP-binding subunit ClpC [Acidobacteriota bacterium]|nr:ATP-dependent Clp protease ATP-binding subunit ClpC [Acidobacteriota bacterium]
MLTAIFITLLLLSTVALWLALSYFKAEARELYHRSVKSLEQLGRELALLRSHVETERLRGERQDASLAEIAAAQTETMRELEAERERALERKHDREREKDKELQTEPETEEDKSGGENVTAYDYGSTGCAYLDSMIASAHEDVTGGSGAISTEGASVGAMDETIDTVARRLDDFFNATTHPRELLGNEIFLRGSELSQHTEQTSYGLLARATDSDAVVACISLEALARREGEDDLIADAIFRDINSFYYWPRFFALRALDAHTSGRAVLVRLLTRLNSSWRDYVPMQALREFVAARVASGESVTPEGLLDEARTRGLDAEQIADIGYTLTELGDVLPAAVRQELAHWQSRRETTEFLKTLGRVWEPGRAGDEEVFVLDSVAARIAELKASVTREPARSVLLVGESGTGKTALLHALAARLREENWVVFEAGASEVIAGQTYIGQIEERVQSIVRQIGGKRVLWVMPNFHEALWAGRHRYSPTGVLDLLLPLIESGTVKLIGEVPSEAYEQLLRLRPKLRTAMQTCRLAPLPEDETLELGRRWAEKHGRLKYVWAGAHEGVDTSYFVPRASERTLGEALQLAKQYLGDKAAPGNLLLLLDATHRRLVAEEKDVGTEIRLDDLLVTLSQLTGLPVQILDEREGLDLSELRAFFERRVLGQPEAVDCLVERVAMIKAGLTDPTRPQGVFLFVGPTGTGKTEIAKTLAEFLFGSPDRMTRLDMSELQSWESQSRILGESEEMSDSAALVNLIRKQPFSVILLDEFEKAHPSVWDLFLQVFDDGRLTDRRGNTADFRHSVIILTSNLGATLPHGASIGFSQEQAQFASASVERAVGRAFRREFVNRIDRVVVFRPLGRGVMRDLLRKELNDVLTRRGLRTRQWAVEWDESAIEFLLEMGFTSDLGARPLKRAVERYLLSPLALTIVNHQFPEGDQFLFVRSSADGQSLDVQFVDPDAPVQTDAPQDDDSSSVFDEEEELADGAARELRLEAITLDPRGTPEELRFLQEKYDEVAAQVENEAWASRKEDALRQMQSAEFWNSAARFSVLGAIEYMDRIEAGLDTAGSLLARLRGDRKRLPPDLVARVAQQLYLLDSACRGMASGHPRDAFLLISASREQGTDHTQSERFARSLTRMYRRWAEKRRMRFDVVEEQDGAQQNGDGTQQNAAAAQGYRALIAVSGYAAYTILRGESGLHVLETPQDDKSFNRARASVRVVAQPDEPAGRGAEALRRQAARTLDDDDSATMTQPVVRRYREDPSPLVRDSARGWRTGRLERVLDGDFDLIT